MQGRLASPYPRDCIASGQAREAGLCRADPLVRSLVRAGPPDPLFARSTLELALPDFAGLGPHHRLAGFAGESLLELGHVRDNAVDAIFKRRMRVGDGVQPLAFGTL